LLGLCKQVLFLLFLMMIFRIQPKVDAL